MKNYTQLHSHQNVYQHKFIVRPGMNFCEKKERFNEARIAEMRNNVGSIQVIKFFQKDIGIDAVCINVE